MNVGCVPANAQMVDGAVRRTSVRRRALYSATSTSRRSTERRTNFTDPSARLCSSKSVFFFFFFLWWGFYCR